jgi:hypothetical protein
MESVYRKECNKTLLYVILGAIIFFIFILPKIDSMNQEESKRLTEKLENIEENADIVKIDKNMCSRQCCKQTQWPLPKELMETDMTEEEIKKYIGSNLSCNFGSGNGCLCVSQDDYNYLANRGNNARSQQ